MNVFKSNIVVGVTAGIAATILAPVVVPVVVAAARPLTKSLLKGGVILYEKGREALAGAGEEIEDMIAEVRAEMAPKPEGEAFAGNEAAGADTGSEQAQGEQRVRDIAAVPQRSGDGA